MFQNLLVCLDGSALAEKILPLARALIAPKQGKLTFLRIVSEAAALEDDRMRDCARRYGAEVRFLVSDDPGAAITAELEREPHATAALTTHGHTAWPEAILGSVALRVIREARRPVVIFRPAEEGQAPQAIHTVAVALDGSKLSEKIIPYAAKASAFLSARLKLLQVLPLHAASAPITQQDNTEFPGSSYLQRKAAQIAANYAIEPEWEVRHGDAADVLCRYLSDVPETLLAMTTHTRTHVERAVIGSVTAACLRRAGVPLLIYWPLAKSRT